MASLQFPVKYSQLPASLICLIGTLIWRIAGLTTVNVEIFAQYIFSRISRMTLDARKYDVSENLNYYRSNRY